MQWLDPRDCAAARDLLQRGAVIDAAQLLLRSPHKDHRAARQLRLEISRCLIERASEAHHQGEFALAWDAIECARQCAELPLPAAALKQQIGRDLAEVQKRKQWLSCRLRQADVLGQQGRIHTALGLLEPLATDAEAIRLKQDLEERMARFVRYVDECHQLLSQGDLTAARKRLRMAQAIQATDVSVLALERVLRQAEASQMPHHQSEQLPELVCARTTRFSLGEHTLVVSQPEIVLGNPLGESVTIPLQARIHRRHVLLVRDHGRYRVVPYENCPVTVNGVPASTPRELRAGDRLELNSPLCTWRFELPVAGSSTAVLDQNGPSPAWVQSPDGGRLAKVILLDETAEIRRRGPAHLVLPDLPCDAIRLRWGPSGLVVEAESGRLSLESTPEPAESTSIPLTVPGQLRIASELSEAEWLGRTVAGCGQSTPVELVLALRCPFGKVPERSLP